MAYWNANGKDGYVRDFEKGGDGMLFDIGADEDDEEPDSAKAKSSGEKTPRCEWRASLCGSSLLTAWRSIFDVVDNSGVG